MNLRKYSLTATMATDLKPDGPIALGLDNPSYVTLFPYIPHQQPYLYLLLLGLGLREDLVAVAHQPEPKALFHEPAAQA